MAKYLQNSADIQIKEVGDDLQFEVIKKDEYISIGKSTTTTKTTTNSEKFNFDTIISSNGEKLTFNSTDNCIVVGTGVSRIELFGFIYVFTIPGADLIHVYVLKNNVSYARFSNYMTNSYQTISITHVIMEVQPGDKIYIHISNSAQPTVFGGNESWLGNCFTARVLI